MGLGIAFRAFSAALFDKQASERIRQALQPETTQEAEPKLLPKTEPQPAAAPKPLAAKPVRSDAITLLSALQREARFVDLIQEDLTKFADAQVGAAARPCLQQCASTLTRFFELAPVSDVGEGSQIDVGEDGSPERYQWIGEGSTTTGKLIHQGWQATKVELPKYSGSERDANVIAPAQVQR
ncbi:DUF2760 domain-containing protein [Novipirellula sp.]|uniref:DUF2760 domain-containing protein n=1 Tax=Novipirellula sp. TaxID=2795430 RepID=UPI003566C5CE